MGFNSGFKGLNNTQKRHSGSKMLTVSGFDVRGSVHHSTILTVKNPTRRNSVSKFYYYLF